jgi:hypothetical protein
MIDFKTQTKRSTSWKEGILNINVFCKDLQFGITNTQSWGDFKKDLREDPLVEMKIDGIYYKMDLSKFIKIIKKNVKRG